MIKFFSNYRQKEDGVAAVEFAIVAIPFVWMVVAIIEISLMFASESLLEGATNYASRQIRTGALQTSGSDDMEGLFRDEICAYARVLINCRNVEIEVQPMASFTDFDSMQPQFDDDGNFSSRGFDAGGSSEKVLIRTLYTYTSFSPLIGPLLYGADNQRLFMSTLVMQSEPYDFAAEVAASEGEG